MAGRCLIELVHSSLVSFWSWPLFRVVPIGIKKSFALMLSMEFKIL